MSQHLGTRAIRAGLWALSQNFATQAIGLVKVIVLARLVAPDDYGAFAVALLALAILEAFSTTGIQDALIQAEEDIGRYLNTAWLIQIFRGVILLVVTLLMASPLANFMEIPSAGGVIALAGVVPLLRGLENIGVSHHHRHLDYKKVAQLALTESVVGLLAAVALISVVDGKYALAGGMVVGVAVRTLASYGSNRSALTLEFDLQVAKKLYRFGRWITLSRVVFLLLSRVDSVVVSKMLGAPALGAYQVASRIGEISTKSLSAMLGNVAFSTYSRVQHDSERVRRGFAITTDMVSCAAFVSATVISLNAVVIVDYALGPQWSAVANVLPWLVWAAAIRAWASTSGALFKAVGLPRLDFTMNLGRLLVLLVALPALTSKMGLEGVGVSLFLASLTLVPLSLVALNSIPIIRVRDGLRSTLPALMIAAVTAASFYVVQLIMDERVSAFILGGVLAIVGGYVLSLLLAHKMSAGPVEIARVLRERMR